MFRQVGLMTPGDMGQAVALQIQARGYTVCTALEGRSARSRELAQEAGLRDLGSVARLVAECDVVLSILNPAAAESFAREAADALRACGSGALVVDCNAVAPPTVAGIERLVTAAGGRFLDAGIIGAPPRGKARTTLYVSGPGAADLGCFAGPQLGVTVVSERVGDASALKMCSGALTKGTQALWLEVLLAARNLGVDHLIDEAVQDSRAPIHAWVMDQLRIMPPKAYRWVPEMIEVSRTMADAGITPRVFEGIADICAWVADTPLGRESPEEGRARARSGAQTVRELSKPGEG